MKKILLSIGVVLTSISLNAQILTANDAATFGTWSVMDVDGDTYTWGVYDVAPVAHLVAQGEAAVSFSWGDPGQGAGMETALTPDNWIVSPVMDFSTMTAASLSFTVSSLEAAGSIYAAEHWAVYAATSLAGLATATALIEEDILDGGTVYAKIANLDAFAGEAVVHIAFRHYNVTDMYGLVLDDVVVSGTTSGAGINENTISATVYPNPASDVLNIKLTENATSVSILGMDGKIISTESVNSNVVVVNVSNLVSGVYFYEVVAENGTVIRNTFVKK